MKTDLKNKIIVRNYIKKGYSITLGTGNWYGLFVMALQSYEFQDFSVL